MVAESFCSAYLTVIMALKTVFPWLAVEVTVALSTGFSSSGVAFQIGRDQNPWKTESAR